MGPEPTLLVAVDGKIEDARGKKEKKRGGGVEESMIPDAPSHSSQFTQPLVHSLINLPIKPLSPASIHSSV